MTEEETASINARFDAGQRNFTEISAALREINRKLEILPKMEADIQEAKSSADRAKELVEAWNAIKTGGKFVRWLAPLIAGVASAWLAVKGGFAHMVRG